MAYEKDSLKDQTSTSRLSIMAALTFTGVMLAGTWQIIAATQHPGGLDFPRTLLDFREGRSTGMLEKQLDQKIPARNSLIAIANSLRYGLTGGAGEQVRTGKNGWLFLAEEIRFDTDDGTTNLNARAQLLGAVERNLTLQGVKLVVALVPDKARLYANKLAGGSYPEYNRSRYQDALLALQKHGVTVVDLLTPLSLDALQSDNYYHSDTHWNQTGARIVAKTVAHTVRLLGVELEKTSFTTTDSAGPIERSGDLIRLMGLEDMPNILRPPPDVETPVVTSQSSAEKSTGLFGDAIVPVTLTGTSYSLRGNFHGYLQQELSTKVLNTAKDGGGFLQAPTAYFTDEAFKFAKPKVLVWEVPERFLSKKLDDEPGWLGKVGFQ